MARSNVLPRTVRLIITALGLVAAPLAVETQQAEKVARIGVLRLGSPPDPLVEAFRQGLRELGYLKTAKALGLSIPQSLLSRADQLIR